MITQHEYREYLSCMSLPYASFSLTMSSVEYLPIAKRWEYRNGKWENVRLPLNAGGRRDIPPGAIFHSTVVARLRSDASYKPLNDVWCAGLKKPVALKNIQHEPAPDKAYFSMQDESTYEIQLGGQS